MPWPAGATARISYACFLLRVSSPDLPSLMRVHTGVGVVSTPFRVVNLAFEAPLFPAAVRGTCTTG